MKIKRLQEKMLVKKNLMSKNRKIRKKDSKLVLNCMFVFLRAVGHLIQYSMFLKQKQRFNAANTVARM